MCGSAAGSWRRIFVAGLRRRCRGNDISACIAQDSDFHTQGKVNTYAFTMQNKCEKPLKCTTDAYVTGAKGSDSGHGTLVIAPKSQGAAAKKSFVIKVKEPGGTAQISHDCKVL